MFQVTVKTYKGKVIEKVKFKSEDAAWSFFEQWDTDAYYLEFKDLNPFRS